MTYYRRTMTEAYKEVVLSEKSISTLKNGVKVYGNALPSKAIADKMAHKAEMETGKECDTYQSPFNNRFYVRIKEELEESFSDAQIAKLKKEYEPLRNKKISIDNANKLGAMFTKFDSNKNALEKLYGGDIPFISTMAMTRLMTKHNYTASKINALRKEEIESLEEANIILEGQGTIKGFRDDKEKANMVSLAKQHGLKVTDVPGGIQLSGNMRKILDMQLAARSHLKTEDIDKYIEEMFGNRQIDPTTAAALRAYLSGRTGGAFPPIKDEKQHEGKMSAIDAMVKAGKSAADIAKALKLPLSVVKGILGEELEEAKVEPKKEVKPEVEEEEKEEPKKEKKEDDKEKVKAELEKKIDEVAVLKQKIEQEKNKAIQKDTQKMVNPETGEPLLQVGIAYKHLRDKMKKEDVDYLKPRMNPSQLANIKNVWKNKSKKDVTPAVKDMLKNMDVPTQLAIKQAKINVLSDLIEMPKDDAYAIGMAQAKKKYNDEPPLDKKTIKKGHEIADKIMKKENAEHPAKEIYEAIKAVQNKAEKSGMPYSILKKVYDRGMAAWRGGHRPGATQVQWALARVNSFVTKSSGTWGGADKDLAAKVKGK